MVVVTELTDRLIKFIKVATFLIYEYTTYHTIGNVVKLRCPLHYVKKAIVLGNTIVLFNTIHSNAPNHISCSYATNIESGFIIFVWICLVRDF